MDTALGINELGDVNVAGNGDQGIRILPGDVGMVGILLGEEGNHIADGHLGGSFEIEVKSHADVLRGSFRAGPDEAVRIVEVAFMNDELEGSGELSFKRSDIDFPVALTGVAVAYFKVRAFGVDREIDGGTGDELLVVHIAAMHPGGSGVVLAAGRSGDTHAAEEGMKRNVDAASEVADHLGAIERDEAGMAVGEVVGEKTAAGAEGVARPGDVDVNLLDANFKDVAGFGSIDGDRTSKNVASGAFVGGGIVFVDVVDVGGDVGRRDAEGLETLAGAAGGESLNPNSVTGFHGQDWFCLRRVEAPGHGGRRGEEGLGGLLGKSAGDDEQGSGAEGDFAGEVGGHGIVYITVVHAERATPDGVRD
jgi:hypothetical protein